jgi:hypothetical protein
MTLSPFASFQTNLGQEPRKIENWSIYTVRAGIALKFGTRKSAPAVAKAEPVTTPVEKESSSRFAHPK